MSYLVLARKYRPQAFDQVIEQVHITRTLTDPVFRAAGNRQNNGGPHTGQSHELQAGSNPGTLQ